MDVESLTGALLHNMMPAKAANKLSIPEFEALAHDLRAYLSQASGEGGLREGVLPPQKAEDHGCRERASDERATIMVHASDCAQHNEPALPNGPCDCGADELGTLRLAVTEAAQYMKDAGAFMEDFPAMESAIRTAALRKKAAPVEAAEGQGFCCNQQKEQSPSPALAPEEEK